MPTLRSLFAYRLSILVFFFLLGGGSALAATFLESTLKDPTGARPLGMGGAFVGSAAGPEAIFFNPAGLGDIGFHYTRGNVDVNQQFFDLNEYSFLTFGSFGYGQWARRDKNGQTASVSSWSYGKLMEKGGWGVTYKTVTFSSAEGSSMDLGWLQVVSSDLLFGALMQDIFRNKVEVKSSLRVGFAYAPGGADTQYLVDGDIRGLREAAGPEVRMHYGMETALYESWVGRLGWGDGRYTLGVSLQLPFIHVDYAVTADLMTGQESIRTVGVRIGGF